MDAGFGETLANEVVLQDVEAGGVATEDDPLEEEEAALLGHEEQDPRRRDVGDAGDRIVGDHYFEDGGVIGVDPVGKLVFAAGE